MTFCVCLVAYRRWTSGQVLTEDSSGFEKRKLIRRIKNFNWFFRNLDELQGPQLEAQLLVSLSFKKIQKREDSSWTPDEVTKVRP